MSYTNVADIKNLHHKKFNLTGILYEFNGISVYSLPPSLRFDVRKVEKNQ